MFLKWWFCMAEKISCELVSWDDVYSKCRALSDKIKNSNWRPDTIVAIARSGFVPGRILSDFLGVADLVSLKVEHWLDTTAQHKDEATIPYKVPFEIDSKKVLVIDDIVDTGKSMDETVKYLERYNPKEIKTAVMQYLAASKHEPHFYATKEEGWTWFVYPWNYIEDSCNLVTKLFESNDNLSPEDIIPLMKENYNLDFTDKDVNECLCELALRKKVKQVKNKWRKT